MSFYLLLFLLLLSLYEFFYNNNCSYTYWFLVSRCKLHYFFILVIKTFLLSFNFCLEGVDPFFEFFLFLGNVYAVLAILDTLNEKSRLKDNIYFVFTIISVIRFSSQTGGNCNECNAGLKFRETICKIPESYVSFQRWRENQASQADRVRGRLPLAVRLVPLVQVVIVHWNP